MIRPTFFIMNDHLFLLFFVLKFYAGTLLCTAISVAILFAVLLRSFRFFLRSTVVLSLAVNVWIAAFVLLKV